MNYSSKDWDKPWCSLLCCWLISTKKIQRYLKDSLCSIDQVTLVNSVLQVINVILSLLKANQLRTDRLTPKTHLCLPLNQWWSHRSSHFSIDGISPFILLYVHQFLNSVVHKYLRWDEQTYHLRETILGHCISPLVDQEWIQSLCVCFDADS